MSDLIDTKENRQLLYKYLVKDYQKYGNTLEQAKEKARKAITNNSSNLFGKNSLAVKLGRRCFEYFCLHFMSDTFVPKPTNKARNVCKTHLEMWEQIQQMIVEDKWDKQCFALPRGLGKTTVIDLALGTYLTAYEISKFTVVGGKREIDSTNFIANIRKQFEENLYIINAFGNLIIKNSREYVVNSMEIEFANDTKIMAVSSGTSVRGLNYKGTRVTAFIADDFQADSEMLTEESRDKKWAKWCDEIENFGDTAVYRDGKKISAASKVICIGTVLHSQCLVSRLLQAVEYKHMLRRAILLEEGQALEDLLEDGLWLQCKKIYFNNKLEDPYTEAYNFYLEHKSEMDFPILWEDKWNRFEDLVVKYWKNPESFKKEYMNDAASLGTRKFKSIATESAEEIEKHDFSRGTLLCIDPAGSNNKDKKRKNYYAFLVGSMGDNGFKYVRKGELFKFDFEDYINHTIELLKKYKDIHAIYVEKNTYNTADVLRMKEKIADDKELCDRGFTWINESQNKNKEDKIQSITGECSNGQIIFNEEDVDFIEQIKAFAGVEYSAFDDAPDITAEFAKRILEVEKPCEIKLMKFR